MLRCQFLCHGLKALFFIEITLKLSNFCQKMQNLRALGAPPPAPVPPNAGALLPDPQSPGASDPDPHWPLAAGVRPQTPKPTLPPITNFRLRAWVADSNNGIGCEKHVILALLILDQKAMAYLPSWPAYPTFHYPVLVTPDDRSNDTLRHCV